MATVLWGFALSIVTLIQANKDEIRELPGLDFEINFKHYSGYLQVNETKFLHYWFVESQKNSTNDPLVFWYNGGPGCSSLFGLLTEHGPYFPKTNVFGLRKNPDSWNKNANVVYMESPIGVGYSYSTNGEDYIADDDYTAQLNYESIKVFMNLYPEFRDHDVYITGESYGGVYVPTLALKILDGMNEYKINLKGIAVGNGLVSGALLKSTYPLFAYGHGLLGEDDYAWWQKECCIEDGYLCNRNTSDDCQNKISNSIMNYLLNGFYNYDLYNQCEPERSSNTMAKMLKLKFSKENSKKVRYIAKNCNLDEYMAEYLNREDVRKELHIPSELPKWEMCNQTLHNLWENFMEKETAPFYQTIVEHGVRVLLYYGDTDISCQFLHAQKFADTLGIAKTSDKTPWYVDKKKIDKKKMGGLRTVYGNLTFTTILGTGHLSAGWTPRHVHYMFNKFLRNETL